MSVGHLVLADRYRDSVALLAVSAELAVLDGVDAVSVVMGTPANLDRLAEVGLGPVVAGPGDLVVAVRAVDDARLADVLDAAQVRLGAPAVPADGARGAEPVRSLVAAVAADPALSLAVVSVPGPYAAAEATKALRCGLHVFLFSDNVPVADEVALKREADERGLLVMGPDCGTALVGGVPLGFANAVRRGPVGVVGASGTGMQEVTTRLHRAGTGVSHAFGVGGRDLTAAVGGRSTKAALTILGSDPATEVIVVIAKPSDPVVTAEVLALAVAQGRPVVACVLGADPAPAVAAGALPAVTLAEAADLAAAVVAGAPGARRSVPPPPAGLAADRAPGRTVVRGLYCGGTFAHEAELLLTRAGIAHRVVDYGDDEYTVGRPHPMIDPSVRDTALVAALADPTTAVVLVDVVLGFGAAPDPVDGLVAAVAGAPVPDGGPVPVLAHVCGTDDDPLPRHVIVRRLAEAGIAVADANADAVGWACTLTDTWGPR
jgi:FdrA protein